MEHSFLDDIGYVGSTSLHIPNMPHGSLLRYGSRAEHEERYDMLIRWLIRSLE